MGTLAVIVFPNQNAISAKEASKIRRTVKKECPEYRLRMYINDAAYAQQDEQGQLDPKEDRQLVFTTSDVNGECGASVDRYNSTIGVTFQGIAL